MCDDRRHAGRHRRRAVGGSHDLELSTLLFQRSGAFEKLYRQAAAHEPSIHGRAEEYARKEEYREKYDLAVSRAVANLSTLSEYCVPYVKVGGMFVPYKSGEIDEEVKAAQTAIKVLGGKQTEVVKFTLPGSDINRSFVKIQKIKSTGKKFPRKAGLPTKEPIS